MKRFAAALALLGIPAPTGAQGNVGTSARAVESSAGVVGQRQNRTIIEQAARIAPMARLDSRVANRIRSRLSTRIDREPPTGTDTLSVFGDADERLRRNPGVRQPQ